MRRSWTPHIIRDLLWGFPLFQKPELDIQRQSHQNKYHLEASNYWPKNFRSCRKVLKHWNPRIFWKSLYQCALPFFYVVVGFNIVSMFCFWIIRSILEWVLLDYGAGMENYVLGSNGSWKKIKNQKEKEMKILRKQLMSNVLDISMPRIRNTHTVLFQHEKSRNIQILLFAHN